MSGGYSGTPLVQKLGLKPGWRLAAIDPPANYWELLGPLPPGLTVQPIEAGQLNCIHVFVTAQEQLFAQIADLKTRILPNGMIWVSWPKRASKVPTDITEDLIRAFALANGLVDIKVCAVDPTWSGLKLVIPVKDRPRPGAPARG